MPKTSDMKGDGMAKDATIKFKVSVLRCRKTGRVLFLEAGKDFVDTLFSFLLLPLGTVLHMLSSAGGQVKGVGGIYSIYESVEKLDSSFMNMEKKSLVQPRPAVAGACGSTGLLQNVEAAKMKRPTVEMIKLPSVYYWCSRSDDCQISSKSNELCTSCSSGQRNRRTQAMTVRPEDIQRLKESIVENLVKELEAAEEDTSSSSTIDAGFVRENITYMVTDNLEVMPSTTIRSIKVLNTLKVATLADLESTDSTVSTTQILELLKSALTSSSCLNDVFGKR